MAKPRLILADDHRLFLDGLRKFLEPDFEVIEAVTDGRAAVEACERLLPDLLLLEVSLPLLNGIETARQIKKLAASICILFVTMRIENTHVEEAFASGLRDTF